MCVRLRYTNYSSVAPEWTRVKLPSSVSESSHGDMPINYETWSETQLSIIFWKYELIRSGFWMALCLSLFPHFMDLLFGQRGNSFWRHNFPQLGFLLIPYTVAKKLSPFLYLYLLILLIVKHYTRGNLIAPALVWGLIVMVISYKSRRTKVPIGVTLIMGLVLIVIYPSSIDQIVGRIESEHPFRHSAP